jgi:hypothetical protein
MAGMLALLLRRGGPGHLLSLCCGLDQQQGNNETTVDWSVPGRDGLAEACSCSLLCSTDPRFVDLVLVGSLLSHHIQANGLLYFVYLFAH